LHDRSISLRGAVHVNKTSLTRPRLRNSCTKSFNERSCTSVLRVYILPVSTIISRVWYFIVFLLIHISNKIGIICNVDGSRQTKSARSRSSSKRTKRIASEGQITATSHRTGPSPRQQNTILRLALRSRDSRRSREDIKYASPLTDYKRLGSSRSFESSISIARRERDLVCKFVI